MSARPTVSWLAAVAVIVHAATALGLPPEDPRSRPPLKTVPPPTESTRAPTWVGEHLSLGVGGHAASSELSGPGGALIARGATLLQLLDLEARLEWAPTAAGQRGDLWLQLNAHPGFIALVWRNWWGVLASGLHGYIGAGVAAFGGATSKVGLPTALGVGLDVPLGSLEAPSGLWLTARAGWRWLELSRPADGDDTYLGLVLSWRWYDVFR